MWIESRVTSWPIMFRRQFAQPIDIDSVFETLTEMDTYLTNALRHIGQIATCKETEGIIYIMNNNRDAWVTATGGGSTLVFSTLIELNTYLSNEDRIAGGIATCLETEGVIYIMNNLRDAWVSVDFNSKLNSSLFYTHTGDTSIHFTKNEINITDLGNSAHTHTIDNIDELQTSLDNKIETSTFYDHTGNTSVHYTKNEINITDLGNSAHTHTINAIDDLQTALNNKTNLLSFNSHIGDASIHFTKNSINITDLGNSAHTHTDEMITITSINVSGNTIKEVFDNSINYYDLSSHTHDIIDINNLQSELNSKLNLTGGELSGSLTATTYYGDGSHLTGIIAGSGVDIITFNNHTGATNPHLTKFSDLTDTGHTTHIISDVIDLQNSLNSKTDLSIFNNHTGDTSIHYTKSEINISDINSAHTHIISNIINLETSLNSKLNLTGGELTGSLTATTYYGDGSHLTGIVAGVDIILFNSHTGATNPHLTKFSDLTDTGHTTHIISDVIDLQNSLNLKTDLSLLNSHTGDTSIHYTKNSINIYDINSAHTHTISDISNLQSDLNSKLNLTGGELTGSLTATTYYGDGSHLTGIQSGGLTSVSHDSNFLGAGTIGDPLTLNTGVLITSISATTYSGITVSMIPTLQESLDLKSTKITYDNTPWNPVSTTFTLSPIKRYDFGTGVTCTTTVLWTLSPMVDVTEDCEYWFKLVIGTGGISHTFTGCTFGINNDAVVAGATYEFHIKKSIVFIKRIA